MRIELERLNTNDKPKHGATATLLSEIITAVSPNTGVRWRCWPNTQPRKQPKLRFLIFFGEPHGARFPRLVRFNFPRLTRIKSNCGRRSAAKLLWGMRHFGLRPTWRGYRSY